MYICCVNSSYCAMELQILTSKKGTKVVTASNLHRALQLADHHYQANVKTWLNNVYEFRDDIRKPLKMKDFAPRKTEEGHLLKDYYLSAELAKLITLNSRSKVKQKYAKWLFSLEDKVENAELLTKDQVLQVLELAKAMSHISCQENAEKQHHEKYEESHRGQLAQWWKYRADLLGYTTHALRDRLSLKGKSVQGKNQKQLLLQVDPYETIRTGVIDLFLARGKSARYAVNLGDLAKTFAKELGLEIFDDRQGPTIFNQPLKTPLVEELKSVEKRGQLSVWG